MKKVSKKKHGGARRDAGRKPVDRRVLSIRIDNTLYDMLTQHAAARDIKVSQLAEQLLIKSAEHLQ
jgi:predicted HicB family RNase H-like nuclease